MKAPALPDNEAERQQVLDALNIVYSPTEERFNKITRIAMRLFDVPIALISLISEEKQWFKSCQGLTTSETSREISFCGHAILQEDAFVIPNAKLDPDFSDNPLVTGEPRIRFYAGQPLTVDEHRIGTLCIIDRKPKHLKPKEYDSLKCLAAWVEAEIAMWRAEKNQLISEALLIENRELYFDDLTGNLTTAILDKLLSNLSRLEEGRLVVHHLEVAINNLPDRTQKELRDQTVKHISQTLHQILGDKGLIAFDGNRLFTILQYGNNIDESARLVGHYRSALAEEFTGANSPAFEITLV